MSTKSDINEERTGLGVHASSKHTVDQVFLLFKVISIIDNTIVNNLSDQRNRGLSTILIDIRHVQIIHEIDKSFIGWGTESLTSSLIYV